MERHRLFRQDGRPGHLGSGERQDGRAPNEDLLVVESVLARLGQDPQRHRGARHPVAAGVGEHADEDLVGVERPQDGPAAMQQGDQLPARELGERRNGLEIGVRAVEEMFGEAGQRRPQPSHPPRPPQAAGGGDRVQPVEQRQLGLDLPGQAQVDGDVAVDAHDDLAAGHVRLGGRARQHHRFAHRLAERGNPQIDLELGERRGEGLGDRTRAVDRPARNPADLGGDRARLQQPHLLVVGDRPLDVLRPAEHGGDLGRELYEPPQVGRVQRRTVVGGELENLRVRRVEQVPGAIDLSAHERLGPAADGTHDPAVGATGHRIDAEHHPAVQGLDQRLDEHRDRMLGGTGPLPRVQHRRHRIRRRRRSRGCR